MDDDGGDNEDSAETASPSRNISRSRLVLPPPKNSDAGDDNGTLSSKAASLSVQEGSSGGGFKRSTLVLPPPRNLDFGDDEESGRGNVGDGHEALFFLDKDGEPNVKRRKEVLPDD